MANAFSITGTSAIPIGDCGDSAGGGFIVFSVVTASVAMDVQAAVSGSADTPADITYYNMLTDPKTKVTTGTDITTAGIYGVICPGMTIYLKASSGSCTGTVVRGEGVLA